MKTMLRISLSFGVAAIICLGHSDRSFAERVAIINATLRSDTGTREGMSVLMYGGEITELGKQLTLPKDTRIIDGTGKVLSAGLIAAGTHLGLVEISAVEYTREGGFGDADPIQAAFRVTDGYNPASMVIPIARNGGITSTVAIPGGGLISGQSAWMTLADGSVGDNTLNPSTALHVTLGRRSTGIGKGSRGRSLQALRALFDDARDYGKNRKLYQKGQTRKYGAGHLDLEVLLRVLQRELPVVVKVDRKSDIEAVLNFAKEYKLRLILQGATEAWMLAAELAAAHVPVMLNPKSNLPGSFDQIHAVDDAAARLDKAGVSIIISPLEGASSVRTLRQLAGLAVAHGLPWERAFAAITTTPARVFSVKRGTLKVGAAADLVLWSGDPLELSSRPTAIFIGGEEQSRENHQTLLLRRYR